MANGLAMVEVSLDVYCITLNSIVIESNLLEHEAKALIKQIEMFPGFLDILKDRTAKNQYSKH